LAKLARMMLVPVAKFHKTQTRDVLTTYNGGDMDAHFIFSLAMVAFAFWLCFKFRRNKKE